MLSKLLKRFGTSGVLSAGLGSPALRQAGMPVHYATKSPQP
jgi:hypothetical protein